MEQKHYFCGVGLVQIYVNVSGEIYGCAANLKNGFLGNVEKGLLVEKIEKYRELARKDNLCIECSLCKVCQSKNCIMNSLVYSGSLEGHNPDICYFERKKVELWNKYYSLILSTK